MQTVAVSTTLHLSRERSKLGSGARRLPWSVRRWSTSVICGFVDLEGLIDLC